MKTINIAVRFATALALLLTSVVAFAQGPLKTKMDAYVVKADKTGKEQLVRADEASPEDIIEYQLHYENVGDSALTGLAITGPIPKSTEYVPASSNTAVSSEFHVSIDGGKTWDKEPVMRMRKGNDGQLSKTVVPAAEYTHVRWTSQQALDAQSRQLYTYRVKIQ